MELEPGPIDPIDVMAFVRALTPEPPIDLGPDVDDATRELNGLADQMDATHETIANDATPTIDESDDTELAGIQTESGELARTGETGPDPDTTDAASSGDAQVTTLETALASERDPDTIPPDKRPEIPEPIPKDQIPGDQPPGSPPEGGI